MQPAGKQGEIKHKTLHNQAIQLDQYNKPLQKAETV